MNDLEKTETDEARKDAEIEDLQKKDLEANENISMKDIDEEAKEAASRLENLLDNEEEDRQQAGRTVQMKDLEQMEKALPEEM